MHLYCYNCYLQTQRGLEPTRCPICRQVEIGEMEWIGMATIFDFDADEYEEVEQLPWAARQYARRFQRGEVTWRELCARVDAAEDAREAAEGDAAGMAETNAPAREAAEGDTGTAETNAPAREAAEGV